MNDTSPGSRRPVASGRALTGDPSGRLSLARRYNALLGGKDNQAVDRRSAHALAEVFPGAVAAAIENRRFLRRAVAALAKAGVSQFLDVGCGLPHEPTVHEVARQVVPGARVVYVDNDPLVLAYARALMHSPGATGHILADLDDPETILDHPQLGVLDLAQPVALLAVGVLHFLPVPYPALARLRDALAPGSYMAVTHHSHDHLPADVAERLTALTGPGGGHGPLYPRTRADVVRLLDGDGWEVLAPGVVPVRRWQPRRYPEPDPDGPQTALYAGVAHRP
ncbi:SAM-dependent methyltransferase [Solwaraspora sp. WMMD1047]|uniref:SAM-dependent methyltransferase n=1 Tax=Solwaraspora sp. WMMD1047 TaxID=3016102 RepID=UPI0024159E62|nr:SAM-dependent methyltransferase [Solwaraspora sp. WMMD1047]MDG4834095.1 SAM-dependent methyltransferase [Solwaraspora sp. WMMD1047]